MSNKTFQRAALALAVAGGLALPMLAQAQATPWMVRVHALNLDSANKDSTGLDLTVNNKVFPEVDISYFFTPNIAAELVLTYPQKHTVQGRRHRDRHAQAPAADAVAAVPLHRHGRVQALRRRRPELHALLERGPARGRCDIDAQQLRPGRQRRLRLRDPEERLLQRRREEGADPDRRQRRRHRTSASSRSTRCSSAWASASASDRLASRRQGRSDERLLPADAVLGEHGVEQRSPDRLGNSNGRKPWRVAHAHRDGPRLRSTRACGRRSRRRSPGARRPGRSRGRAPPAARARTPRCPSAWGCRRHRAPSGSPGTRRGSAASRSRGRATGRPMRRVTPSGAPSVQRYSAGSGSNSPLIGQ